MGHKLDESHIKCLLISADSSTRQGRPDQSRIDSVPGQATADAATGSLAEPDWPVVWSWG